MAVLQDWWSPSAWMPGGGVDDLTGFGATTAGWAYGIDAWQRSILLLDVLRKRGNQFEEHKAQGKPPVLEFDYELVMDGQNLAHPCNYMLLRILPPKDQPTDPDKRPIVVVDPRAGHGPGIGGFKDDSQVGVALAGGHPCYFVSFRPQPVAGQTLGDVARAEAEFLKRVADLHPNAPGKPAVIGNCQAGWAVTMLSALAPELVGPIFLAGSPLSYWSGVEGENPMRYLGGLLGGTWMTSLANDLGNGTFDGAYLVKNFENLNPANTFWKKLYNLYAKVDTEEDRFLEFEKWWGGFFLMTADEINAITNELFVGNKLTSGELVTEQGERIDIRNIRSPIVVFCSFGDNITPPQQALGWITDLYDSVDEIRARGQTIVYGVDPKVGHLGIFVSGRVARKTHAEFASNLALIDVLPPGLYEAVLEKKDPDDPTSVYASGDYITRFEMRTIDDIKAYGGNDPETDMMFATVARVSEINQGLYETLVSPWLRMWVDEGVAKTLRELNPKRVEFGMWSDQNPWMQAVGYWADLVRAHRQPVDDANPFVKLQNMVSDQIAANLDRYRDQRDDASERWFRSFYGAPLVQAAVGLGAYGANARPPRARDTALEALIEKAKAELIARIPTGGVTEGAIRALTYIGMSEGVVDERGFNALRQLAEANPAKERITLEAFGQTVKEQYFMLLLDERAALATLPDLIATPDDRAATMAGLDKVMRARGDVEGPRLERLRTVATLLGMPASADPVPAPVSAPAPGLDVAAEPPKRPVRRRTRSNGQGRGRSRASA